MRFGTIFSLALGLPVVVASPCKPGSSTETSDAVSTASSAATVASTSVITSAELTTTTVSSILLEATEASTVEISLSETGSTTTESETTTAAISSDTTETSSIASTTTSSEPEPIITNFNIIADGGEADGIVMGQKDNYFNLQFSQDVEWKPAALTLEKDTGYLRRADPWNPNFPLICIRWASGLVPNPGWFVDCSGGTDSWDNMIHPIKCELKAGGELSCSIPAGHCRYYKQPPRDNDGWDCQGDDGEFHDFYTQMAVDDSGVTYYSPWMGFSGFEGQGDGFGNDLESVKLRWRSAD